MHFFHLWLILLITCYGIMSAEADMAFGYHPGDDALEWYSNESDAYLPWVELWRRNFIDLDHISHFGNQPFDESSVARRPLTDEERLTKKLFHSYASSLRPVYDGWRSVDIWFGLILIQIGKMDEVDQSWLEERLRWNPGEFSDLAMIRIPTHRIWTPDIVLYNSADDFDKRGNDEEVRAMVDYTGQVFLGPYVKLRSTCILDLTLYPYDEQNCQLIFGSWTYDSSQLTLTNKSENVDLSMYVDSAKWELLESSMVQSERRHSCCEAPFSDIHISIKMRRRFLYNNLFNIFIPTICLSALCLMCFYLAPESGEKIALGITVLLTFTLFTWMIAENTPRTSDFVPLISIYLTVTMSLSALVVALQVFMLNVHGLTPVLRPVPKWLRIILIDGMATFFGIKDVDQTKNARQLKVSQQQDPSYLFTLGPRAHCSHTWRHGVLHGVKKQRKFAKFNKLKKRLAKILRRGEHYRVSDWRDNDPFNGFSGEIFSDCIVDDHFDGFMNDLDLSSPWPTMDNDKFMGKIERFVSGTRSELNQPGPAYQLLASGINSSQSSPRNPASTKRCRNCKRLLSRANATDDLADRLITSVTYMKSEESAQDFKDQVASEWRLIALVFDRLSFWFFFAFTAFTTFRLLVWTRLAQKEYPKPQDQLAFSKK